MNEAARLNNQFEEKESVLYWWTGTIAAPDTVVHHGLLRASSALHSHLVHNWIWFWVYPWICLRYGWWNQSPTDQEMSSFYAWWPGICMHSDLPCITKSTLTLHDLVHSPNITKVSPDVRIFLKSEAVWLVWAETLSVVMFRCLTKESSCWGDDFQWWPGDEELMVNPVT